MIIKRLHQEIKYAVNKLDSQNYPDLVPEMIDDVINFVQNRYVEDLVMGNNNSGYNYGFEIDRQRLDMLQTLVIPDTTLSVVSTSIISPDCIAHVFNLPENYKHYIRFYYSNDCKFQPIDIKSHDQLNSLIKNDLTKPSLIWERAIGGIESNTLKAYIAETISDVTIEYIKQPRNVFFGGYNTLEYDEGDSTAYNTTTQPITSELPEQYHYLLVDLCAQEIYRRWFYPYNKDN